LLPLFTRRKSAQRLFIPRRKSAQLLFIPRRKSAQLLFIHEEYCLRM